MIMCHAAKKVATQMEKPLFYTSCSSKTTKPIYTKFKYLHIFLLCTKIKIKLKFVKTIFHVSIFKIWNENVLDFASIKFDIISSIFERVFHNNSKTISNFLSHLPDRPSMV